MAKKVIPGLTTDKLNQLADLNQNPAKYPPQDFTGPPAPAPAVDNSTQTSPSSTADQVFTDSQTGKPSGVTINGKTYLGLSPADVETLTGANKVGPNTAAFEQNAMQQQQQAANAKLISQLQNYNPAQLTALATGNGHLVDSGLLGGILPPNSNLGEAAGAGITSALPGVAAGAVTGAISGAVGGPVGALGGAVLGGVGAFLGGFLSNLRSQQSGLISAKAVDVRSAMTQLTNLRTAVNMGMDPGEAVLSYEQIYSSLTQQYSDLKRQTQGTAAVFGDGTPELERYQIFFSTTEPVIRQQFYAALANPNLQKVSSQDLLTMAQDLNNQN